MCYIGSLDDDSSVAKMATEDIKVWKLMDKEGDAYAAPFRILYVYPDTRNQSCEQLGVEFIDNSKIFINEGLHAYTFIPNLFWGIVTDVITECYIPKGSVYFTNGTECVSQNLIFDKSYDYREYVNYYSSSRFKRFFMRKPKPVYIWKD